MRVYSYVMIADNGFAPNPYYGICTLACCKPRIRKGVGDYVINAFTDKIKEDNGINRLTSKKKKELGLPEEINLKAVKEYFGDFFQEFVDKLQIWIIGTAGKNLKSDNPIVYIMQVTDVQTYEEYWNKHEKKRPYPEYFTHSHPEKNSSYEYCGDNIYEIDSDSACIRQLPSFHYVNGKFDSDTAIHDLSGVYVLLSDNFVYFGNKAVSFDGEIHKGIGEKIFIDNEKLEKFIMYQISNNKNDIKGRPINSDKNFKWE